jgi:Na+-transporting NADH:ubiquinone oxidoreductase subunit NqrB
MEKINMEKKLLVSASPHIRDHISTRRIMLDVVIALAPAALLGIYYHGLRAALLIAVCIVSCVLFEYIAVRIRKKPASIGDCSAIVTGLLLAMSLPPGLPVWMAVYIVHSLLKKIKTPVCEKFVKKKCFPCRLHFRWSYKFELFSSSSSYPHRSCEIYDLVTVAYVFDNRQTLITNQHNRIATGS